VGTAVVLVLASVLPDLVGMGPTLVRRRGSMLVCLALFLVGGWGLARDIDFDDRLRAAEGRALDAARAAERAELLALRAHLDPHFLFNTLNAIAEWCRQDGQVAERAVLQLSSMLRAILSGVRAPAWPLDTELGLVQALFDLYQLRDDQLYRLQVSLPERPVAVQVPPLLLLPLAENAIKHGPAAGHRGPVKLTVLIDDPARRLTIRLENAGSFAGERDGGEGLRMVRKRLELAYPARSAALDIRQRDGGTVTEVTLPLDSPPGAPT
jgi:LytS/YehU family sensor histidine kinase